MPCGKCGQRRDTSQIGLHTRESRLVKDRHGMIPLASHEDCRERYHGQFQGTSLLVAGRGTPKEKLFVKGQLADARRYATTEKVTLDNVHVTSLCHDAVVQVLSA